MVNEATAGVRKCVCGLDMVDSKGVHMCINWDGIQEIEQEVNPRTGIAYDRVPTPWDEGHEKDHQKKIRQWYPEQFKGWGGGE